MSESPPSVIFARRLRLGELRERGNGGWAVRVAEGIDKKRHLRGKRRDRPTERDRLAARCTLERPRLPMRRSRLGGCLLSIPMQLLDAPVEIVDGAEATL